MPDTTALQRFQDLLRDLFQFDLADLDFGIYRLLRLRRDEVEAFLREQLPRRVDEAFREVGGAEREAVERDLARKADEVRATLVADAIGPDGALDPRFAGTKVGQQYEQLRSRLAAAEASEAQKADVFNYLYDFFSRYYEAGDFVPRRYYGASRERFAVPYNGEETLFTWANRGQHYVKTGEAFRDYAFTVDAGLEGAFRVRLTLTAADVPPGNTKGDARYFFPQPQAASWSAAAREWTLPFHYRLPTEQEAGRFGRTGVQEAILDEALPTVLDAAPDPALAAALGHAPEDDQGNAEPPLLLRRMRHFTRRNTTDYFIHRDLEGFLLRELEFFLKDQVLHLGDLDADLPAKLRVLRTVRTLAREVAQFLAQIEEVQRRLFEKRKLVLRTDWLVLIKDVPRGLWPEVLRNEVQLEAWRELFAIDPAADLLNPDGAVNEQFLSEHPTLVVDTQHFRDDPSFVDRLLEGFDGDLDEATGGVLIQSENYQALRLLQRRYAGAVKCIYIDPPYNTGSDDFIYKDRYQHSSWLTMMEERLRLGRALQSDRGFILVSIDDSELNELISLMDRAYGETNRIANLVWDRNRKNDAKLFSVGHEYMVTYARDKERLRRAGVVLREEKLGVAEARAAFRALQDRYGADLGALEREWRSWLRGVNDSEVRKRLRRYTKVDADGPYRDDRDISWPGGNGPRYEILHPTTGAPVPVPARGWVYPNPERFWEEYEKGHIKFGVDESTTPSRITRLFESTDQVLPSVFYSYAQKASQEFRDLFGAKLFDNPKNWRDIMRMVRYTTAPGDTVVDYFAGSGTTGHATIELNRMSGESRRFVLVELGEHFATVLLPRVQKVLFASRWKKGAPVRALSPEQVSRTPRLVKILRLESYEDALHNLTTAEALARAEPREAAHREIVGEDAYRLRYFARLPLEANPSLLHLDRLEHPFRYTLEVLDAEGAREEVVDLIESFNLAYGLQVDRRERWTNPQDPERRYRVVRARNSRGQRVLVLWRDVEGLDPAVERRWLEPRLAETGPWDDVLCNADSATPGVRSLDPEFKRLMSEPEEGL